MCLVMAQIDAHYARVPSLAVQALSLLTQAPPMGAEVGL